MLDRYLFTLAMLFTTAALGNELSAEGYDVDPASGLRMERYRAPVPDDVPGGITLDTEQLAILKAQKTALLIDVHPPVGLGPDPLDGHWVTAEKRYSIPGSIWLPEVGLGTLSNEAEHYFKRNIARLTQGNPDTPVVFFCTSDCWQSWNASRRAILWGYSAVHWYPLGTDGWQETGAELVRVMPVNFLDDTTPELPDERETGQQADKPAFPDKASIYLLDQQGEELLLGTIEFSATLSQASTFQLTLDSERFVDQFLSMRPFRCLSDAAEWFCHLPYPYTLKGEITPDDLTELEYQLLFIWKSPKDFGIDAWNGVYYPLAWQGNDTLRGELLQGDLNVLADPPAPYSHPIDLQEFIADGAQNRLYPSLIIRP